jgi:serine/arginine repetitive matrix protein 2
MSRLSSGIGSTGFDSFEEVWRGFEFSDERIHPLQLVVHRIAAQEHRRHECTLSIMSIASYGHASVIDAGLLDPFDYDLPSLREESSKESREDMSSITFLMDIDDTFAFMENRPGQHVESDASRFYFRAPLSQRRGQSFTHRNSNMSVSSHAPSISIYNRSLGTHGSWANHRKEVDSVLSIFF